MQLKRLPLFLAFSLWIYIFEASGEQHVKIAVIHDFKEGLRLELDAIIGLFSKNDSNTQGFLLECEEFYLDSASDFAKTEIFHVGERLRKNSGTNAVVGPSNSGDVVLFHPHVVLMEVPHVAPVATDPTLDAMDRFPQLIRMQQSYRNQISAVVDIVTELKWKTLAILSSESDYAHHAGERLREAANQRGIKVLLNQRLSDLTRRPDIGKHLGDIRRSGQRIIVVISEEKLAAQILTQAISDEMTGAGWAWLLWSDAVDNMLTRGDILRWGSRHSRSIRAKPKLSSAFPDIPGLLALRTAYTNGSLHDEFFDKLSAEFNNSGASFPTVKKLKYVDAALAAAYGVKKMTDGLNLTLLESIVSLDGAPGVTEDITFDIANRQASYTPQFEILNSKARGRWWSIGKWTEANGSVGNASLILDMEKLALPGGVKEIISYLPQVEFQTFKVVTMQAEPFVNIQYNTTAGERKESAINDAGVQYSGFCIELLQTLSSDLGFKYTIKDLGQNAKYGSRNPVSGYWNGLIGELVSGNADLIVAPITVTEERTTVVDITGSFMETELKFAINREAMLAGGGSAMHLHFSFLRPFSPGLWVALLVSVIAMALYLTLISRLSPFGAHGRYFQSERGAESSAKLARRRSSAYMISREVVRRRSSVGIGRSDRTSTMEFGESLGSFGQDIPERESDGRRVIKRVSFLEEASETRSASDRDRMLGRSLTAPKNQCDSDSDDDEVQERRNARRFMSINNALYFACAGLLWQSPECVPRAPSARVAAGIWYMVGVIIVASYTANMVAFVTQTSASSKLDTVEKLLDQRLIFPGTVASSSVDNLLITSNLDVAEKLYKEILRHPHVSLQPTVASALNLTNRGELAFVWEGVPLDYAATKSDCHITTIPIGFGRASYAFALRRDSLFTDLFDRQILKYRQTGYLEQLSEKYFSKNACKGHQHNQDEEETYVRLTYSSLSGVFLMVGVAAAVGLLILAIEWVMACLAEIDTTDTRRPPDFITALKLRYGRLAQDFSENWLPFKSIREHWSKFRPATSVSPNSE